MCLPGIRGNQHLWAKSPNPGITAMETAVACGSDRVALSNMSDPGKPIAELVVLPTRPDSWNELIWLLG